MPEAVICAAVRSPIGRAGKGSLTQVRADDMATQMVRAVLARVPQLNPHDVEDLVLGCGLPGGEQGRNLARVVAVELGFDFLAGTTVNRYCASSLQSVRMALHAIRGGEGDAYICAGVESVSRLGADSPDSNPDADNALFAAAQRRTAQARLGPGEWHDPRVDGLLPDVYIDMGQTAENVANLHGVTRAEMDEFALRSQQLAAAGQESGCWAEEITPLTTPDGAVVDRDDCPRPGTTLEALAGLKPAFRPEGRVTAGNSCPLNDGAAAMVVTSDVRAAELGISPIARVVATAVAGISPEIMGMGPVPATQRALARAGMTIDDIDLVEINEAFAVQVIASARELAIDIDTLNVSGGAIAIGHPFGMTGVRMVTTLLHNLQSHDRSLGLATLCVGGGQGMAMIVERLS